MKTKFFLLASCLFMLGMFTNSANAQYASDEWQAGYQHGFNTGKMYALAANGFEYMTIPQGNGLATKYRRPKPDYVSYNSMLSQIRVWKQDNPDMMSYYNGYHEGLYDGFVLNIPPWEYYKGTIPGIDNSDGPSIIPSQP